MTQTYKDASVIIKSKFTESNNQRYKDYVNYIDRDESKNKSDFSLYNNYMDDAAKATSLFTEDIDQLDKEKKEELKHSFKEAQKRGSILWQDVISFDNQWLQDNGIYDKKTKTVDESKLKDITRLAMKDMLDKNHINNDAVWSGAIHHNTDNIHIHVATVELSPRNDRGKRKLKSLEKMKSTYVNKIMDRSMQHEKINDILRNQIVNDKKNKKTFSAFDRKFKKDYMEIYNALPENKRYWNYGYQNINHVKPKLNELTKNYIEKYYKHEFQELEKRLDNEVEVLKQTYGKKDQKKYNQYKDNKIDDLYKRMGNAFLKEMKEYDKKVKTIDAKYGNKKPEFKKAKKNFAIQNVKYGLDRIIYNEMQSNKNQKAFQQLQRDMQRNNERGNSM